MHSKLSNAASVSTPAAVPTRARFAIVALGLGLALGLTMAAPTVAHAEPPDRPFGLGLMLGAPSGLSAKYYLGHSSGGSAVALQAGLGVIEEVGDDGLHFFVEVVWHPTVLARTPSFDLPFYLGVGGRVLEHDNDYCFQDGNRIVCYDDDDTHVGVRVPFGLLMDFNRVPLDVFFEIALVADLIHSDHGESYDYDHDHDTLQLNGALGVRYYF